MNHIIKMGENFFFSFPIYLPGPKRALIIVNDLEEPLEILGSLLEKAESELLSKSGFELVYLSASSVLKVVQ